LLNKIILETNCIDKHTNKKQAYCNLYNTLPVYQMADMQLQRSRRIMWSFWIFVDLCAG